MDCASRRLAPLLVVLLGLVLFPGTAAAKQRWTGYDRPAKYETREQKNVAIEMTDGVRLRANVERPDARGPWPVLIIQTPYNKDGPVNIALGGSADYFAQRGYAVVTVDVRGTGASEGSWDSFGSQEQRDGLRVVRWARNRRWSDGKVGLFGPSYMAITQLYTAAQRPRGLKAIFPIVPLGDGYRDITFSGGQPNVAFIPFWLGLVTAGSLTPSPDFYDPADPLGSLTSALEALLSHVAGAVSFQATTVLDATAGGTTAYDGWFWKTRSPIEVVDRIKVPTFVTGGLHDLFQRGAPLIYERLKDRVPTRLLMGPWNHVEGSTGAGLQAAGLPSLNSIALRWFDRWVRGKRRATEVSKIPMVTQWMFGRERYKTFTDWPPRRLDLTRRYLRGGGDLAKKPPPRPEDPQGFLQQPLSGICTQSTSQWTSGLGEAIPCTEDNRLDELGSAVYTSPVLRKPLDLVGPIMANLWVTSTARDAVLTVRVTDVGPDGASRELTAGWLAASFRATDRSHSRIVGGRMLQPWHPFTKESLRPLQPGQPTRMKVEIFPTAATIQPGHRLRISVNPADFPHQVPPISQFGNSLAGQVEVLTGPEHASYVELPGLGDCAKANCAALPVPNLTRGKH